MKKMMLGLVAAFALASFGAPAYADDAPAADKTEKKETKGKKGKKGKTDDKKAEGGDAK